MRVRALLVVTAALAAGAAVPASAATRLPTACNLVKDGTGDVERDAFGAGVDVFSEDSALDVVSADIATGSKTAKAVFRLAGEPKENAQYASRYIAEFRVDGIKNKVVLAAAIGIDETRFNFGFYTVDPNTGNGSYKYPGTATGTISGKTITVVANLVDIAANENLGVVRKNAKINGVAVTASRRFPSVLAEPQGQLSGADTATGRGSYVAGQASCIKPA